MKNAYTWQRPPLGQTFGHWTVQERNEKRSRWSCRCVCGEVRAVSYIDILEGRSKCCGCMRPDTARHGHARKGKFTPEYAAWASMINRCEDPKSEYYDRYGGRGIAVCSRWRADFTTFLVDVGQRPSPTHSLDRYPNNDGNYEPGNVRWATRAQQARNKSNNRMLAFNGLRMCLKDWANRIGVSQATLRERLEKWPLDWALTAPPGPQRRRKDRAA